MFTYPGKTEMGEDPFDAEFMLDLSEPKSVGRYEIVRKLGQGGTGVVYLGKDRYIKRYVAIKMSLPNSEKSRVRFFQEAQSAGRLNHPNIVAIYDADLYKDFCYLTLEYVDGPTLKKFCQKDSLLPLKRVVQITLDACNGLDYAHKRGVIHKDIKPSNIIIDESEGRAKITDFGIAQITDKTAEIGIFGTPSYMSPEQAEDKVVGSETDIFSLGCVLYELLTGQKAFLGSNHFSIMYKIINEEAESILKIRPELPQILDQIIRKALAKDIAERYSTCMAFADDLRVSLRGLTGGVDNEEMGDMVDYIHHVPFFHNFTRDQLGELLSANHIIRVPRGKVVVEEGEISDTFYIVLSGSLNIKKGREVIAQVSDGECFGEMAYIAGQGRSATVMAESDCILMEIPPALVERLSESIQLLFFKNFATTLVRRLSKSLE